MKHLRNILCFLFVAFSILNYGQSDTPTLEIETSTAVANETMLTLMVRVGNQKNHKGSLHLHATAPAGIRILNNSPVLIPDGSESQYFPLKIFIDKKQPAGNATVVLDLLAEDGLRLTTHSAIIKVQPKRLLQIVANEAQAIMKRAGDSLRISTQVYNRGNQPEKVAVVATFPEHFGDERTVVKTITLSPFSSSEVSFSKIIDRELLRLEMFTVNVAGLNNNKDFFGNVMVVVQNALGNRLFIDPRHAASALQRSDVNYISYSTSNPFSSYDASHNLSLHSEMSAGRTGIALNVNGTYWQNTYSKPLFQNTYLRITQQQLSLQLGNLNAPDLDANLYGRGAEVSYGSRTDGKFYARVGVLEKNYNLFDAMQFSGSPRGYAAYAKSVLGLDDKRTAESEVVLESDAFQRSLLFRNSYQFGNETTNYDVNLGYGYTRSVTDPTRDASSLAAGFNYRKSWKNFYLSSNNYYADGYYPGIKKGSASFEQRVTRQFNHFSLSGAYTAQRYRPQHIDPDYNFDTTSDRSKAELGATVALGTQARLSLTPQWSNENAELYTGSLYEKQSVNFTTGSVSATLMYHPTGTKNQYNITYAHGFSRYTNMTHSAPIYKAQAGWYRGGMMVNLNYQKGNFMLYEGNYNGTLATDNTRFSAMAGYQWQLPDDRFQITLNTFANFDSRYGNSLSASTATQYRIGRFTKISGSFVYNTYAHNSISASATYYQLGLTQTLPSFGDKPVNYKNGQLRVFAFYDNDRDGVYTAGTDQPASGTTVQINKTVFITDARGYVTYRRVPYGNYDVKIADTEWFAPAQHIQVEHKNALLTIPLVRTGIIKGQVRYETTTKSQYDIPVYLAGIPVNFTDAHQKTHTFYTDAEGNYTAFVPLGNYRISIDSSVLQKNVYIDDNVRQAVAEKDSAQSVPAFILKVRQKKVDVKKFG